MDRRPAALLPFDKTKFDISRKRRGGAVTQTASPRGPGVLGAKGLVAVR